MNEFIDISSKDIEEALLNLRQLTFEVTDRCNLRCKYCGYGELYEGYDKRESKYLAVSKAKFLIDYLVCLWKTGHQKSVRPLTYISFYGGEPLLNMSFIREIIAYIGGLPEIGRTFVFSMTTNAMLLDRYIDYLVETVYFEGDAVRIHTEGLEQGEYQLVLKLGSMTYKGLFRVN